MASLSPWRAFCGLAVVGLSLQLVTMPAAGEPRLVAAEVVSGDTLGLMFVGLAASVAAIVHARGGWRESGAMALAIAAGFAASAYVTWAAHPGLMFDRMLWARVSWKALALLALLLPPALLWARRARASALLSLLGGLLALAGVALMAPRAVAFDNARALPGIALFAAGVLAAAVALGREAYAPHPAPARPFPAWAFAGPVVLAFAWGFGGNALVVLPLWILAPVLLAMPALARWRARPSAALVAGALLLAGALIPLGTCSYPNISDVVRPNEPRASPEGVQLWEVAGHGPYWVRSDLMGAGPVICSTFAQGMGALWLAALAAVAWTRWPEPSGLVRWASRLGPRARA